MVKLQSKVELFVPGTIKVDQKADTSQYVKYVASKFCLWFGGATVSEAVGYYLADSGALVTEHTRVVWSFCTTSQLECYSPDVISLAEYLCDELGQECIAIVINGVMFMVAR